MIKIIAIYIGNGVSVIDLMHKFTLIDYHKVNSFYLERDRQIAFASELLKKYYLAKLLGKAPNDLQFITTKYGKLYLTNEDNYYFNISHSGQYIILAISNHEIGIDIELGERILESEVMAMSKNFCDENEQKLIAGNKNRFLKMWVKKEALMKYQGTGFMSEEDTLFSLDLNEYQCVGGVQIYFTELFLNYSFGLCTIANIFVIELI